ncbi:MAG: hypothetical protein R2688_08745 [Fimbriimonadaceae bacterium]
MVASSTLQNLKASKYDLWDSGKVNSSATFGIEYAGSRLSARAQAWWQVQSWDQDDEATGWSEPAYFAIGLNQEDWQAQWIHGAKPISTPEPISDAHWIWAKGGDPKNFHAGTHIFARIHRQPG